MEAEKQGMVLCLSKEAVASVPRDIRPDNRSNMDYKILAGSWRTACSLRCRTFCTPVNITGRPGAPSLVQWRT